MTQKRVPANTDKDVPDVDNLSALLRGVEHERLVKTGAGLDDQNLLTRIGSSLSTEESTLFGSRLAELFRGMEGHGGVADFSQLEDKMHVLNYYHKFIEPVPGEKQFRLTDDRSDVNPDISSLPDLRTALEQCSDDALLSHSAHGGNDFAKWIEECLGDVELASALSEINVNGDISRFRREMIDLIDGRIRSAVTVSMPVAEHWIPTEGLVAGRRDSILAGQQENVRVMLKRNLVFGDEACDAFNQAIIDNGGVLIYEGFDKLNLFEDGLETVLTPKILDSADDPSQLLCQVKLGAGDVSSPRARGMINVVHQDTYEDALMPLVVKEPKSDFEVSVSKRTTALGIHPLLFHAEECMYEELLPGKVETPAETEVGTSIRDRGCYLTRDQLRVLAYDIADIIHKGLEEDLLFDVGSVTPTADLERIPETHVVIYDKKDGGTELGIFDKSHVVDVSMDAYQKTLRRSPAPVDSAKPLDTRYNEWRDGCIMENLEAWMCLIQRNMNEGADAVLWAQVETNLIHNPAISRTVSEGSRFYTLLTDVHDEVRDPATWGGDRRTASYFNRFLVSANEFMQGQQVPEKPKEFTRRLALGLSNRGVTSSHAEAIVHDLQLKTDEITFQAINFDVSPIESPQSSEGYSITAFGPEEKGREKIESYTIKPSSTKQNRNIRLAAENGLTDQVLYTSREHIVQLQNGGCTTRHFADRMSHASPEERKTSFRALGRSLAMKANIMLSRNVYVGRDGSSYDEPGDYFEDMRIVGGGSRVDVMFNGWDKSRVDLSQAGLRPKVVKDIFQGVAAACNALGEGGSDVFAYFDSYLPRLTRTRDEHDFYQEVIDKTKQSMIRDDHRWVAFFQESGKVKQEFGLGMPQTILEQVKKARFRDPEQAFKCITDLCMPGIDQARDMQLSPQDLDSQLDERLDKFTPTAVGLLTAIHTSGLGATPDNALTNLRRIATTYDVACARVYPNMGADVKPPQMPGKEQLFELIQGDSKTVATLASKGKHALAIADGLLSRGPYLAKTFLETVATHPETITDLTEPRQRKPAEPVIQDASSLAGEISEDLQEIDEEMTKATIAEVTKAKVDRLNTFSKVKFINLVGYRYTELMKGELTIGNVADLYNQVSELNNFVIATAVDIAKAELDKQHGTPSCRFAIVEGGAGARREFPTFDHDMLSIYEREGNTSNGVSHSRYFNDLNKRVSDILTKVDHHPDWSFSISGHSALTMDGFMKELDKPDNRWRAKAYTMLAHGAGDNSLSQESIGRMRGFIFDDEQERNIVLSQRYYDRQSRRMEEAYSEKNVKISSGGLRDVTDVMWLYKLRDGLDENSTLGLLDRLGQEIPDSFDQSTPDGREASGTWSNKMDELTGSYLWLMNVRISMDFHYGRNDKNLPEREVELQSLVNALGYYSNDGKTAIELFMQDYGEHKKRIRDNTDDIIDWMFTPQQLQDMNRVGAEFDRDPQRALGFSPDGTPLTPMELEDVKRREQLGQPGLDEANLNAEPDEHGQRHFLERDDLPSDVQDALDNLRGSTFMTDPVTGKKRRTRWKDWEAAIKRLPPDYRGRKDLDGD